MRDTQLYQQILGLAEPWFVGRVELKMQEGRVDIFVEHRAEAGWQCPECGKACRLAAGHASASRRPCSSCTRC